MSAAAQPSVMGVRRGVGQRQPDWAARRFVKRGTGFRFLEKAQFVEPGEGCLLAIAVESDEVCEPILRVRPAARRGNTIGASGKPSICGFGSGEPPVPQQFFRTGSPASLAPNLSKRAANCSHPIYFDPSLSHKTM